MMVVELSPSPMWGWGWDCCVVWVGFLIWINKLGMEDIMVVGLYPPVGSGWGWCLVVIEFLELNLDM